MEQGADEMFKPATVVTLSVIAIVAAVFAFAGDDAQQKCQAKGFSYDTCFHSLNR
jgi:hypothetical protein